MATLQSAAATLNADCVLLRERVASADETEQQQDQVSSDVIKLALLGSGCKPTPSNICIFPTDIRFYRLMVLR